MNFQVNKKRNGFSSTQCDSGKNIKGVRRSVMSQRATNEIKAAICSARLKKLRFECFKDVDKKELYSPTYVDEKRKQSSIIQPSLSKRCEKQKPTSKKFQEFKVYKSFMEEQETADLKRSTNGETSRKKNPVKVTSRNTEGTTEAANLSRVKHPDHAVRRYALFRGMICQSRFEEDHKLKKDRSTSKESYSKDKRKETNEGTTTVRDKNNKHRATQSRVHHEASSGNHVHETINVNSRNDDLRGTQGIKSLKMRQRKTENKNGKHVKTTASSSPEKEKEVSEKQTSGSWLGLLKYSLVLLIPGFLNHAALYREGDVLRPPGELYDIGWKQRLFMGCTGRGPPTVILDAPTGESSDAWALIAPQISKVARVCVYDRAGLGFSERPFVNWSDPEQSRRGKLSTSERMVEDFHRLFTLSSDQPKPFILVGAELGAVNARFYTQMFENNVASLVLINPLVEGMFDENWTKLWYERYVANQQALQFSAATGITRIALVLGLMKESMRHKSLPLNVTLRQKYLLCKPGHLSAGVDEYFFANESLAQMRMVRKVKPFPQSVDVSIISSAVYDNKLDTKLDKVWSTAQEQISNVHSGSEKIKLSGNAQSALLDHSETIVKVIKKHVDKWKRKQAKS